LKKFFHNTRGMTLVEVIVAAALVTVIILSLVATVLQSSVFAKRIDQNYTATYIAQRRIDLLKRLGFDQVSAAEETDVRVDVSGNMSSSGIYARTTEVDTNYGGNASLAKVKVTVQKMKINIDGIIEEGVYLGQPVIMETLFSDIEQ
jgi:type II secretory pathway pseudopilin PulG